HSKRNERLKELYSFIHQNGPISRVELLEKTKIKKTTLARMMDDLLNRGYILESGIREAAVGRPPTLYVVNPQCGYIIGIHISRVETRIVLTDVRFQMLESESFTMTSLHTPSLVLERLAVVIESYIKEYNIAEEELLGIAIGTIGPLNLESGEMINP